MKSEVILQVALDMMNKGRALSIAEEAVSGGADWIEAGTPLIKSEGAEVIRELKKKFPGRIVVADMKTMDTGGFEIEIAAKAGADIISVLGASDDSTISEAVKSARNYGSKIMVDLLGVSEPLKRAKRAAELGADYLSIHIGIDQQMRGDAKPSVNIKEIVEAVNIPVAVAGGLTSETIPDVIKEGATIMIVGGAIIKAIDVKEAAQNIRQSIDELAPVASAHFKRYSQEELYEAFTRVSSPNISDAMHKKGAMKGILPRIKHGTKAVGRAVTVRTMDGDWAKPVEAIDKASAGDIVVVDAGQGLTAIWGELASWSAKKKGVRGVVVDGTVRDIDSILDIGFPVFSRHIAPNAGEPKGLGETGTEIICGGRAVRPGDWIIGDESGVVVVPQENAVEIANRALDIKERENRLREEIKKGGTLSSLTELEKWEQVG